MKKIFIFDPYPSNRELLSKELAAEGNTVAATGKPEDVMDSVNRINPDLVILDLYVGEKIRWDLLFELKAFHREIPVLIFTGCPPPGDLGVHFADAWVRKSLFFGELKAKIIPLTEGFKENEPVSGNSLRPLGKRMNS